MTEAYVTLATNDRYALGALVLAHSLREVNTTKQICIIVTPGVSDVIRSQLSNVFNNVVSVDVMDSKDSAHLALLKRPELGVTFTKLHSWNLTQYTKCVFLDADILAIQNADELFEQPELSAACDIGWPDCFNSGMFVFSPSPETFKRLLEHADSVGSFDGGDQGLLNTFFPNWNRLSFIYNMVASVTYTYSPAFKQYGKDVKFVHFLGATKPWQQAYHTSSGSVVPRPGQEHISSHLNAWWRIFTKSVQTELPESVAPPITEASSPVHEFKQPQDAHDFEQHTHDTHSITHINESEHTPNNEPQQVMTQPERGFNTTVPDRCVVPPQEADRPHAPSHYSHKETQTRALDPSLNGGSQKPSASNGTQSQSEAEVCQNGQAHVSHSPVNNSLNPDLAPAPPSPYTIITTITTITITSTSICRAPPASQSSSPVSTPTTTPTPPSTRNNKSPTPTRNNKSPTPTRSVGSPSPTSNKALSKTTTPSDPALTTPKHSRLPRLPTKAVPELRHTNKSEGTSPLTERPIRRTAYMAGRNGKAPVTGKPSPSLNSHRIHSSYSAQRKAPAVAGRGHFSELTEQLIGLHVSPEQSMEECRQRWEHGNPDFRGEDSFDNILAHIDSKINK